MSDSTTTAVDDENSSASSTLPVTGRFGSSDNFWCLRVRAEPDKLTFTLIRIPEGMPCPEVGDEGFCNGLGWGGSGNRTGDGQCIKIEGGGSNNGRLGNATFRGSSTDFQLSGVSQDEHANRTYKLYIVGTEATLQLYVDENLVMVFKGTSQKLVLELTDGNEPYTGTWERVMCHGNILHPTGA
ncbi:hypothetical protein BDW22DRAFT_312222 [Trametopsis cervina]|nr:hypothetical protein BDW22DRAFT_312222 [Trametopsis cervina]